MKAVFKSFASVLTALALGACASTSTNMSAEDQAEMGAAMFVMQDIDGKMMWLSGAAAYAETNTFRNDRVGFFLNIGDMPPGILPAIFSNRVQDLDGQKITATFKNLPGGDYGFVNIYDETRSNCFNERTKIFDVKPGYVNLVIVPPSKGFLKKGFFESKPESPSVDWDYSVNLSDAELLKLYETGLKAQFEIDMPVRISEYKSASFETRSRPKVSYLCFIQEDLSFSPL